MHLQVNSGSIARVCRDWAKGNNAGDDVALSSVNKTECAEVKESRHNMRLSPQSACTAQASKLLQMQIISSLILKGFHFPPSANAGRNALVQKWLLPIYHVIPE